MKQTAVEWLIERLYGYPIDDIVIDTINQAKEMEKEQIKEAHNRGGYILETPEEYYNETYKNGNR